MKMQLFAVPVRQPRVHKKIEDNECKNTLPLFWLIWEMQNLTKNEKWGFRLFSF